MKRNGFTLIELLVVIAIIAGIIAIAAPNYLSARQRANDVKKKQNMAQLKTALRMYYNDYNTYPGGTTGMVLNGCGALGTNACPCVPALGGSSVGFATGAACDNVYMKNLPGGFLVAPITITYYQTAGGDDFCLRTVLENLSDPDIATSQSRCATACGTNCNTTGRYCACAD